ncbi:MAG TPA: GrpB family protein [Streptosporangiaceae bacterium]|nr:GrpB family protein [Streptosporangiaceae bacterium]
MRELLPGAVGVDHIGSTSVPGLAAKDCLDVMVQVRDLADLAVGAALESHGYRRRPEPWNSEEVSYGVSCPKQVFAAAAGGRPCNIHVRVQGGLNVRYALLFRDFLTADRQAALAWGRFKARLAGSVPDLADYGQIKAGAQEVLMLSAERWATAAGWCPPRCPCHGEPVDNR